MNDLPLQESTMAIGLLMEGAQAHQRLAESGLQTLRAHAQGLDEVVRDEIRRTLTEELASLQAEIQGSAQALRALRRLASWRAALFSLGVSAICGLAPLAAASLLLPTPQAVAALSAQRDRMSASLALLKQQGGGIELKHCGTARRLCVRIDPKASRFGEDADFAVLDDR